MSHTDNNIRGAVGKGGDCDLSRDETFREMIAQTFRGRTRWITVLAWVYALLFTAAAVVSAVLFFKAGNTRNLILWATVFLTSVLFTGILKLWFWMAMNRNSLLREIKRLESLLAKLEDMAGRR